MYCNDKVNRSICEKQYKKSHLGVNVYLNQRISVHYFEVPAYDVSSEIIARSDWLSLTIASRLADSLIVGNGRHGRHLSGNIGYFDH